MQNRTKTLPIVLISFALSFSFLQSQNPEISFHRLSLDEGLSQSIVNCITQDKKGFMWFATEDGLNRFDGYNFTYFKNIPNDSNSISYNQVTALICDTEGILWAGAFNGGLNRYDPINMTFQHYRADRNDPESINHDIIWSIFQDRSGYLWIGTEDGLNKLVYNDDGFEYYTFRDIKLEKPPMYTNSDLQVRSIAEDENGNLWVGTNLGLYRLNTTVEGIDETSQLYIHLDINSQSDQAPVSIKSIYLDHQNTLWIGTDNGLFKMLNGHNENTLSFKRYHSNNSPNSLSNDQIFAIYEDRHKNLWIGTGGGGLNRMDRTNGTFRQYINNPQDQTSLSYDQIRSIFEDRSGVLWIGTYGGGVCKINNSKKAFRSVYPDPNNRNSLNQEIVWSIYEDSDGILWIGTHGGGLNRYDRKNNKFTYFLAEQDNPNSISSNIVRLIIEDHLGYLWLGTHGGGLCRYDRQTGQFMTFLHDPSNPGSISHNEIRGLLEDSDGFLWIGTRGGGLNRLNLNKEITTNSKFSHFKHDPEEKNSISINYIREIIEDRNGNIWIGTLGGGINILNKNTRTFIHHRAKQGKKGFLTNDYIFSIFEDSKGIIWIGTWGGGLNHYDPQTKEFRHYSVEDGLPNEAIYGVLEDDNFRLWISTNKGISCFDPKTKNFRNYSIADGLLSDEFNGGAYFQSKSGEIFFGNIKGFNSFFPDQIIDNPYIPELVITSFQKFNHEVEFDTPIWALDEIELSYEDYVFSISFSALEYTFPENNRYSYRMLGLNDDWIETSSDKRYAGFTTLPPGEYIFQVKGSNNDGKWNEEGTSIRIKITPPYWQTWWFALLVLVLVTGFTLILYRRRLNTIQLTAELEMAHNTQMSIMPQNDPQIKGYDISGICVPAYDVGGDFFDFVWLGEGTQKLGIFIGDVSGKGMSAAMTAVLSSGMLNSLARQGHPISEIMSHISNGLHQKTDKKSFIATLFFSIDIKRNEVSFTNAGLNEPILKSSDKIRMLKGNGPVFPLGILENSVYGEERFFLKNEETLFLFTDGIVEAQNKDRELYGDERLMELIRILDTRTLSAAELKNKIIADVQKFVGSSSQFDDMTLIVIMKKEKE